MMMTDSMYEQKKKINRHMKNMYKYTLCLHICSYRLVH